MRRSVRILGFTAGLGAAALLAGCSSSPAAPQSPAPAASASGSAGAEALQRSTLQVPDALAQAPFDEERTVFTPDGWTASVWARTDGARVLAWAPDGRLLVSRPESGDVQVMTPGSDPAATPEAATLLSGLTRPHGLAFDGDTLYVAESDRVSAYRYAEGRATDRRTVVDGLPDESTAELRGAYAHALKTVAVGQDGALYIVVGSTGNTSAEDRDADPERATIMRVPAGGGEAEVYARGVRNGTGIAVAPDGAVWTAVNNRDRIAYPWDRAYTGSGSQQGEVIQEYVNDHPIEPVAKLTEGRDLGWPYCNPDPDVDPGDPDTALDYSDRPFVKDVETNADGSKLDCDALQPLEQGLPAHSAPLGMAFVTADEAPSGWGAGALIGVHGSWNRTPPRAPEVAFMPYSGGSLGDARTLLGGFQLEDGSRWGRPVVAVPGPDGAIYVSDDQAGAVYRLAPA